MSTDKKRGKHMQEKTLALMEELTQLIGIAGDEREVSKCMKKYLEPNCDEIVYDNLGSIFALKRCGKENAKRVMVSGHMDEVGFMITGIQKNGLLKFILIGSIDGQSLHSQRVRIKASNGCEYLGTIVMHDEDIKSCDAKKMLIDFGAESEQEAKELGIRAGDSAVLDGPFKVLGKGTRILSKAWDNRFGCIMAVELLEQLKDIKLDYDLYIGATVMEEVGMRGGTTATGLIHPDMGVVMDCSFAQDIKGNDNAVGQLGKGILVRYYDKGMMPNRALLQHLVDTCEKNSIAYQYFYTMGNTDAAWVHKLFAGCPTLSACICARNGHTGSSIIDVRDYEAAKSATFEILKQLTEDQIEAFKAENR